MDTLREFLSRDTYGLEPDRILGPEGVFTDKPLLIIDQGRVKSCGPASGVPLTDSLEIKRLKGATIVTGAVDTHHHVTMPFVKGMAFGEPAQLWKRVWFPLEAAANETTDYLGAKWTFIEALRGGFTTIVDSAVRTPPRTAAVLRAATETGIRLVASTGVYDLQDFETDAATPDMVGSKSKAVAIAVEHKELCAGYPLVTPSIAGGTVQSNSPHMIEALAGWCKDQGILFQIHANEHTAEVHRAIERHSYRPIELLDRLQMLGSHVLIAHATLVTPEELIRIAETDTALSYNPVASQWKGNAVADALTWRSLGIRFGLGTDNTRNDAFRLVDAAEASYRVAFSMRIDDFEAGGGSVWWEAATIGGARSAGLEGVGELIPGAHADFLILNSSTPETMPSWDLAWELGRYYDKSNIRVVVVGGRPRVIDGQPVDWDLDGFLEEALEQGLAQIVRAKPVTTRSGRADGRYPGPSPRVVD